MADEFLTLLDLTNRTGTDAAVGLVEEVTTFAPEVDRIMGRPIPGISYKAKVRQSLKSKSAFRNVNEGVEIGSSKYSQKQFDCFYFDSQLQVDEALLDAEAGQGNGAASVLADEASGATRDKMIAFGSQLYKGTADDAKGFPGLIDFLDTGSMEVDAQGTGGTTYRAWFIWMHQQGVHFLFGNNKGLQIGQWDRQQVKDANGKSLMARVNNLSGYIGLSCAHTKAVGCIKNITSAKPLTDALGAELMSKFPIGQKPNLCFIERNTSFWLQKSRSFTSVTNAASSKRSGSGDEIWAPEPTSIAGVPIVVTDSIASAAAS